MTGPLPPATEPPPTPPLPDGTPTGPNTCPNTAPHARHEFCPTGNHSHPCPSALMCDGVPNPATAPCGAHPITEDCCCICHEAGRTDERRRIVSRLGVLGDALRTAIEAAQADLLGGDGG